MGPALSCCMWLSSFSSTICREDRPFLTEWSLHLGKSVNHRYKGLFLGSLFCSFGFYLLCQSHNCFWLLWLCSMFWNQEVWDFQLCSSFLWFFWLFGILWRSIWILGWAFLFLYQKVLLRFLQELHRICTGAVSLLYLFSSLLLRSIHVAMRTLGLPLSYLNFCCSLMVTHPLPWGTYGSSWFPRSTTKLIHKNLHDISMRYSRALIRVI